MRSRNNDKIRNKDRLEVSIINNFNEFHLTILNKNLHAFDIITYLIGCNRKSFVLFLTVIVSGKWSCFDYF